MTLEADPPIAPPASVYVDPEQITASAPAEAVGV